MKYRLPCWTCSSLISSYLVEVAYENELNAAERQGRALHIPGDGVELLKQLFVQHRDLVCIYKQIRDFNNSSGRQLCSRDRRNETCQPIPIMSVLHLVQF